jgi:DNA recombination protein RmuC
MKMITTILIACGAALVVGGVLFVLLRPREADPRLDRLLTEVAGMRATSESVDRRFDAMSRAVSERVGAVEERLADGQKNVSDTLGEVREKMGRVFQASERIERLAGDMTRLEDLLKPPKIRGNLGETFLEQALSEALPPGSWEMRHVFPDRTIVDAVIYLGERLVPVDSKFPLENFRRAREAPEEADRKRARREFGGDVRRHVDAIREKYIRPFDGTFDFALMYVPAEAVYCEIASDDDGICLADYATERRVIPVSPRLLYTYLATVAMGLRGMELQKSARDILDRLSELEKEWGRVEAPFQTLGSHIRNAQGKYEETSRALERFGGRLSGIARRGDSEIADEEPLIAALPPPA